MMNVSNRVVSFTLMAIFAVCALGQDSTTSSSSLNGFRGSAHFSAMPFAIKPITGAAYSGEEVSETVQTLADGTHITRTMAGTKVYRDSSGRTRTERAMFRGPIGLGQKIPDSPMIIEIIDPVSEAKYTLDTPNKIAHRQVLPSSGTHPTTAGGAVNSEESRSGTAATGGVGSTGGIAGQIRTAPHPSRVAGPSDVARPQMVTEDLGTQTIEGVLVEGTRRSTTWPAGTQDNDRPITTASETWMSPELKVMILNKTSDPRNGDHTQKLIHVSRSEPDPSLFQPPPDFTVVDEKTDFTITWGSHPQ